MTALFPENDRGVRGYHRDEVDAFLGAARAAFERTSDFDPSITAQTLRASRFSLVKKDGYSVAHVDEALHRLEDAFALREREQQVQKVGRDRVLARARRDAQHILEALSEPTGKRFERAGRLGRGYSVAEVDAFADRIAAHLRSDAPLSLDDVHSVTFPAQRGGYREGAVDGLLDELIAVLIAVL